MVHNKAGVTRRQALKHAVAGVSTAALCGIGIKELGAAPVPRKWDLQTDVVIVGSGCGLAAALTASASGSNVMVLEKTAILGGSMAISGGGVYVPNNSLMKSEGIRDSRENALTYLRLIAQGQAEEEILTGYVDNAPDMADFLATHSSVEWEIMPGFCSDYHPEWPGSVLRGRSLVPVLNGKSTSLGLWRGPVLARSLISGCKGKGVKLMLQLPVKRLITRMLDDGRQEVLGVIAERNGKPTAIRAGKGVILAAGGFDWNFEMKRHFLRGPAPYATGIPGLTGDGIKMAMAAGADLRNMNECWGMPVYKGEAETKQAKGRPVSIMAFVDKGRPGAILVNRYGERFCNESSDYDSILRSFFAWENWGELRYRNLPAYLIMDQACLSKYGMAGIAGDKPLPEWVKKADTLKELAQVLGIDPEGFLKHISDFNEKACLGQDTAYHRGESFFDRKFLGDPTIEGPAAALGPVKSPPFYGAEIAPGDIGTCGGARVNKDAQVLTPFGQVIPRLYACANNSGVGAPGAGYAGVGGTLGPGMTFAYLAARHAVMRTPWT